MTKNEKIPAKGRQHVFLVFASAILVSSIVMSSGLAGCSSSTQDLETVEYTPLPGDDWGVSTPVEQGQDPMLLAELYHNSAELERLYGLLVVKDGHLIAEGYSTEGSVEQKARLQSATESVTSTLVGIALDRGCLSSVEQRV